MSYEVFFKSKYGQMCWKCSLRDVYKVVLKAESAAVYDIPG